MVVHDLPLLAIEAAIGIDGYLAGKPFKRHMDSIKELADTLYKRSKSYHPMDSRIFAELFWPNKEDLKDREIDEMYLYINLLAKDLSTFTQLPTERQQLLKQTCIKLSDQIARYSRQDYQKYLVAA